MEKLKQSPGVVVEEMDDEILLYKPSSHQAIHLNGTAAVIWKLCDGTRTVKEIVDCLLTAIPGTHSTIIGEVRETVSHLEREGVLVSLPVEAGNG